MPALFVLVVAILWTTTETGAWDYEGHRLVNELALASLPEPFPDFVRTPEAKERLLFLSGEPDRWRNTPDLPLKHVNAPDHYIDLEDLALANLDAQGVSPFRYEFVGQLAAARAADPSRFPPSQSGKDEAKVQQLIGFLPWTIAEQYAKLKSAFSYLKVFEELGTPEEVANAQENVVYLMGVMGHFIGDAAQPLHTTKHFNGWIGKNPRGFTTNRTFHAWIDGGFFQKAPPDKSVLLGQLRPAKALARARFTNAFPQAIQFIVEQHQLVEPLYQLEKEGKLKAEPSRGTQGADFLAEQLIKAAQFLGDLWYTAWRHAPADRYLKSQLSKRKLPPSEASPKP